MSPGQLSEKSAQIAASFSTSCSNFEVNKTFHRKKEQILVCSNHDAAMESECMPISLIVLGKKGWNSGYGQRIVLFVSYVEFKLQGAMLMFKTH